MAFSRPRLWVVYGLPASGKSTIAAALADVIAVPVFVACQAAEQRLVARLKQRELDPPLSDARLGHLAAFKQCFDPITDMDQALHIRLDTGLRPSVCLRQLLLAEVFSAGGEPPYRRDRPRPPRRPRRPREPKGLIARDSVSIEN